MQNDDFNRRLWLSSVPLVRLNEQKLPDDIASGCLIDYFGKRLLLTVSHATGDQGRWAIPLRYSPSRGIELYLLGQMNFLKRGVFSEPEILREVDFSYVEVPPSICAYRQEIEAPANIIRVETPIDVHTPTLEDTPNPNEPYGFCGMVMPESESHFGNHYLSTTPILCPNLSFLRTEDDYYVFALPFDHPGHNYFKGCSGAPILSRSGALVALVCKGYAHNNEIWGVSVREYKAAIDILVGNVV